MPANPSGARPERDFEGAERNARGTAAFALSVLDRPVLVVGTPRSGKTCVWNMLAEARDFVAVCEPLAIWYAGPSGRTTDRWTEELATDEVVGRIRESCAEIVRQAGGRRYLDNLSYHALRLPFIRSVMPEARIIHTVRDPIDGIPEALLGWTNRDTVRRSIAGRWRHLKLRALPDLLWRFSRNYVMSRTRGVRETWGPRPPGLAEYAACHTPAEIAAWQWVQIVTTMSGDLERLGDAQVLQVRYEDLVSRPRQEAARIARFADVEDEQAVIEYAARTFREDYVHHEPTRRELSPEDWKAVSPMLTSLRARLGYARGGEPS